MQQEPTKAPLRLAFMGTPDFAVPILRALLDVGHEVVAVYTQPPRPAGRGHRERPSPVHRAAEAAGISVQTPTKLNKRQRELLEELAGSTHIENKPTARTLFSKVKEMFD